MASSSVDDEIQYPATHCDCGAELVSVPYAMDVWEHDVPILGVRAGDPVAFCEDKCPECNPCPEAV